MSAVALLTGRGIAIARPRPLTPLLDVLVGNALCEGCLASRAGLTRGETRDLLRRIAGAVAVEKVQSCLACGAETRVYTLPMPARTVGLN